MQNSQFFHTAILNIKGQWANCEPISKTLKFMAEIYPLNMSVCIQMFNIYEKNAYSTLFLNLKPITPT